MKSLRVERDHSQIMDLVRLDLDTHPVVDTKPAFDPSADGHALIVGRTASGKTWLGKSYAQKAWECGYDVWTIDYNDRHTTGVDRALSELTKIMADRQRTTMECLQDKSTEPRIVIFADGWPTDELGDPRLLDLARYGRRLNMALIVTTNSVEPSRFPLELRKLLLRRVYCLGKTRGDVFESGYIADFGAEDAR